MTTPIAKSNTCLGAIALAALVGGLAGAMITLIAAPKGRYDLHHCNWDKAKLKDRKENSQEVKKTRYITLN